MTLYADPVAQRLHDAAMIQKVGPHGYIHNWIFVGVPGAGAAVPNFHVHHTSLGRGKVTSASGSHVHVKFDNGKEFDFPSRPAKKGEAKGLRHITDSSGRDVSDLPDEDFAGPHHSYPIKEPKDISHSASLAHHADDPHAVRLKIKAIAQRKFPGTKLPPSLQNL